MRCYFGIENIALTTGQKQTLINGLKTLGPAHSDKPCELLQFRPRLDNDAAIFEADFDVDTITIQAIKTRLATLFGVQASNISHTTNNQSYAGGVTTVITFKYATTNRVRMALFGGVNTTWEQSHSECLGYLRANAAAWESAEQ